MRRLLPDPKDELTDDDLLAAYAAEPGSLRVNFVQSADGAVTLQDKSAGLSGPPDKRVFGLLRDLADVVLVAAGTIRGEGYGYPDFSPRRRERRVRAGLDELPTFAIVSRSLDLDLTSSLFESAPVRTIVFTPLDATPTDELRDKADVVATDGLTAAVAELHRRGHGRILCEGGPTLFASLLGEGLVDELALTLSPLLAGPGPGRIVGGPPIEPRRLTTEHVLEDDGNLFLRYTVNGD